MTEKTRKLAHVVTLMLALVVNHGARNSKSTYSFTHFTSPQLVGLARFLSSRLRSLGRIKEPHDCENFFDEGGG